VASSKLVALDLRTLYNIIIGRNGHVAIPLFPSFDLMVFGQKLDVTRGVFTRCSFSQTSKTTTKVYYDEAGGKIFVRSNKLRIGTI